MEDVAYLAEHSELIRLERGEQAFRQGDPCDAMYIVASGTVRVVRLGRNQREHVLHLCVPGDSFGEVAVLGEMRMPASAIAASPSVCVKVPKGALQSAIQERHEFCRSLLRSMAMWTRHFVGLLDDLVLQDALGRIARYLLDLPSGPDGVVHLPATKKDIANHLHVSSETFSRVLRNLADEGQISVEQNGIQILDADALMQHES